MTILVANLLISIGQILGMAITLYQYILIGRIIVSWVNADPYNPFVRFLVASTEPILYRIRRTLRLSGGGIDFSPMILFLILFFANGFLVQTLVDYGMTIKSSALSRAVP